jgi:protein-disulfide isomerase
MNPNSGLATALVAAIVAALVSAATFLVISRSAPGGAVDASGAKLDDKAIVDVVHDYLTKNPEILVEMTTELDKRQQAEESAKQQKVIGDNADAIFRSPKSYSAGNPDGDVTVVEFFDYNCGYCKRALPDVVKLIDNDDKVRVVFKELPIFGEESEEPPRARWPRASRANISRCIRSCTRRRARPIRTRPCASPPRSVSMSRSSRRTWKTPRSSKRSTRPRRSLRSSACRERRST